MQSRICPEQEVLCLKDLHVDLSKEIEICTHPNRYNVIQIITYRMIINELISDARDTVDISCYYYY